MMRKIVFGLMLGMATPALAAPLWQNVEAGMTVEQVKALYPAVKGKVRHLDHSIWIKEAFRVGDDRSACKPNVTIEFSEGVVSKVEAREIFCSGSALSAMIAKYGEPATDGIERGVFAVYRVMRWTAPNGVLVKMSIERGDDDWFVEYTSSETNGANSF